jgi:hypothetical protein
MFEWWRDHLLRAEAGADVRTIRVWGTVGNKTDIVLEWPPARSARSRGKHDDAGKSRSPRPECERCDSALAHAADNDDAGAAAGQPRDRRFELSQTFEERLVAPTSIKDNLVPI